MVVWWCGGVREMGGGRERAREMERERGRAEGRERERAREGEREGEKAIDLFSGREGCGKLEGPARRGCGL